MAGPITVTLPNFVALRDKVCEISLVEKFCSPEKQAKVHPRSPDLSPIDRPYTSFVQILCTNFGSRPLRFRYIAGFVSQMPLLYIALVFHPKFGDGPQSQIDEHEVQCSKPGPWAKLVVMLFSENIKLFNHSARTLQTDRQTNKQTDRQTGLLWQYCGKKYLTSFRLVYLLCLYVCIFGCFCLLLIEIKI